LSSTASPRSSCLRPVERPGSATIAAMLDRPDDPVARARSLAPSVADAADEIERQRRLPDALTAALHEAGLFRLLLPGVLGGAELDPASFVRVTETLARADASTAWVICQTNGCSMVAAYLRPDVAHALFGGRPTGVLAWGPPSSSRAVVADGGYRLSGTFNFASGVAGGRCPRCCRRPDREAGAAVRAPGCARHARTRGRPP
jgi:alkylation response protein AidB-like acyl-CoA dehydrogenase